MSNTPTGTRHPEGAAKAEKLLRAADRIKIVVDEAVAECKTQPAMQFWGPPISPQAMLMRLAFDRSVINTVMDHTPEPEEPVRPARDTRLSRKATAESTG
jgi:hypothetical protein